ncbi:MAG TPA: hypothetical protein VF008_02310 [Niastella sp.]
MIIFGTRTSSYRKNNAISSQCSHCGNPASIHLQFATRYFHIFWIPIFPIGTIGLSECTHCKKAMYRNEMPPAMQVVYKEARQKSKTPLKFFSGLLLAGVFFVLVVFAVFFDRNNSTAWIQAPRAGDVYEVKEAEGYTLYKVVGLHDDSVTLVPHQFIVEKSSRLRKLKREHPDDYDNTSQFSIVRKDLKAMYDARTIKKVNR